MLKLAGAMLIVAAGTLLGFLQASRLVRRPRQIRQMVNALQRLETEIAYGLTPLPQALAAVGRRTAKPLAALFAGAADALRAADGASARDSWLAAVDRCWPATAMGPNERETVRQLGYTLGVSDREEQIKHLRLAVKQLQDEEGTAREEQRRYEKMWRSAGVLGGLLIVILMY